MKLLALATLSILLAAPVVLADSKDYVGALASTNCAGGVSTGSACFRVPAGATSAAIEIVDAVFGSIQGSYSWVTPVGTTAGVFFCPGGATVAVPAAGASRLIVSVAAGTPADACGGVTAGTTGTITADFA
ncbi:MAG TPA: hypothetical protein VM370_12695 [Candidatus Thermoplasmatota archaeon]|nr:hypothetical protein [Candidatus Thermoplasmatota archaeon]